MIDFRYHLVSLMAVLIALTMGVILGAGPLQGPLSAGLNGEVERITEEKSALKAEVEASHREINQRNTYIDTLGTSAITGTLAGTNVALIQMPGATAEHADGVRQKLEQAGATVTDSVQLLPAWNNEANSAYRDQLSASLPTYLLTPPATTASAGEILGDGLVQVLTSTDPKSQSVRELLESTDLALVKFLVPPTGTAKSVVVIGNIAEQPVAVTPTPSPDATKVIAADTLTGFAQALVKIPGRAVVVGDATSDQSLLSQIRAAKIEVATVDSLGMSTAEVSTPLALANAITGNIGAWGFGTGATAPVPPVVKAGS